MSTDNKKAPSVRSGDEINPVLGSIIKIGGLIVIAALAVLITFILINVFKKDKKVVDVYEDSYHLDFNDFLTITNPDYNSRSYEDLNNKDIAKVIDNMDDNVIYLYFYYGTLTDELLEGEVEKFANMNQDFPLFFVNLDQYVDTGDDESGVSTFEDIFGSKFWTNTLIDFTDSLEDVILNKEKYKSFILVLDKDETRTERTIKENIIGNGMTDFIAGLEQKLDIED